MKNSRVWNFLFLNIDIIDINGEVNIPNNLLKSSLITELKNVNLDMFKSDFLKYKEQ